MSGRRFFILDEPCPSSEIQSMMCRVVADKLLPLQKYAPVEQSITPSSSTIPAHSPQHIIPEILPAPSLSTNRKIFLNTIKDNQIRASLTSVFGLNLGLSNEQRLALESDEVKRYSLNNPSTYFDALMENEHYARDIVDLLKTTKRGRGYLVTGFLTTRGTTWAQSKAQSQTTGFFASVPVSAIAGVPLPSGILDPSIEPSTTVSHQQKQSQHIADEVIFAVAYSLVTMSGMFSGRDKKKVVVGPPKRAKPKHMALGVNDDSESEEEESQPEVMLHEDVDVGANDSGSFELDAL